MPRFYFVRKKRTLLIASLVVICVLTGVCFFLSYLGYRINSPVSYSQMVLDNIYDINKYSEFTSASRKGVAIPGLDEGAVPQGICYIEESGVFLITSYHKGGAPSAIFVVDEKTGLLIKSLTLQDHSGTLFCGHVGGIASDGNWVWISSENTVFTIPYKTIENSSNMAIVSLPVGITCPVNTDYIHWDGTYLWVGEYSHPPFYNTDPAHFSVDCAGHEYNALILGYSINHVNGMIAEAEVALYAPEKVQGIIVQDDGSIILSCSFWSFEPSKLICFSFVDKNSCESVLVVNEKQIPAYYLDSQHMRWELEMPPMSEGIVLVEDNYHILFESASRLYSWYTSDRLSCTMIISSEKLSKKGE